MLRLLILDDEEVICKTLDMMIKRMTSIGESETFLAYDGYTALDILSENEIDIILTDLCMDEMDGLTFIEKVVSEPHPPRIIAVSAYGSYDFVRDAFKLGIFDYIMKPLEFSVLESAINKCIAEIRSSRDDHYDVIEDAKAFIKANIEKNLSLVQVSNHVSMDYSYFSKYFKRMTGQSFTNYLMSEKMRYCEQLLKQSNIRMGELAARMGYNNAGNFSRAFHKCTGKWPTEYKNEVSEEREVKRHEDEEGQDEQG